jgi:hypothetical protein
MTRLLTIGCLALTLCVATRADDKTEISGNYEGKGTGPNGAAYEAKVEISKNGDTYAVKWELAGNETYEGIGILEGDIFSVSYTAGGNGHGIVAYKVTKGKLDGKWSPGDGKIYTETLTKK